MRLPTVTAEQKEREDAREFNERLYAAYQAGTKLRVHFGEVHHLEARHEIGNAPRLFWGPRGFKVRLSLERATRTYAVWIEPAPAKPPRKQYPRVKVVA